jgi:hypothetical protein
VSFVLNLFKNIMKKLFKRTVMLSAALLMTSAMWAAVIGDGLAADGTTDVVSAACGESELRLYKCSSSNPLDSGCGNGDKEGCAEQKSCGNLSVVSHY